MSTVDSVPQTDDPFGGMTVELAMLTPEMADQMSGKTRWQRRLAKRTVKKYAQQQSSGQWKNFPSLYVVSKEGDLLDGGHRNAAVCLSRVGIPIALLTGASPDVLHAIDVNKPRNLQTNLELDGERAAKELAGILKFLKSYRETETLAAFGYTIEDYYALLHQELQQLREIALDWAGLKTNLPKVPIGLFGTVDYLVRTLAQENQHQFFLDCARGEAVGEGDPAFEFRGWVLNLPPKRTVQTTARIGYALIQCWDKFRRGQQISRVRAPGECPEIAPMEAAVA